MNEDDEQATLDQTPPKQQQKNESKEAFFSDKRINEEILPRLNLKENLKLKQIVCNAYKPYGKSIDLWNIGIITFLLLCPYLT